METVLVPRDARLNLDYGGYLADPDGEYGHIHNPDVVRFSAIKNKPVLILLGEPGIGKSHFLSDARTKTITSVQADYVDLGICSNVM